MIIKATDLAGSQGIYKAVNKEEAFDGFCKAMSATRVDYVLVEKFLQGREFGARGIYLLMVKSFLLCYVIYLSGRYGSSCRTLCPL